jgi:hypothetical protein
MVFRDSMKVAERSLIDGATLEELRDAARNLRALTPDSALAELVEARIAELEKLRAPRSTS